jgi:ubiquinone/menaquinone biosynthesis C-methylase UbiE
VTRGPHHAAPSFARAADAYERARPGYAPEAAAYLVRELDLRPGRVVVDVGAGTGKLARQLAPSGARVIALEPLAEMRALVPAGIEVLDGRAEGIPLPDDAVDAVTVAQAFHWFDRETALREIERVLRPGGKLAIVRNVREPHPFDEVLDRNRAHRRLESPPAGEAFPHVHHVESFAELASTESSIITLPDDARAAALAEFERLGGGELRYVTYVHILQPGCLRQPGCVP